MIKYLKQKRIVQGKNTLFWLIKSLSRGEKRTFKLFASKYNKGNENILVWLFEQINTQDSYNEEQLLNKLKKQDAKSPLAVLKTKLFNAILQALRGHSEFQDNPLNKINERREFAYILFQRGLFKEASTFIEKALILAEEMEYYHYFTPILDLQHQISRHYFTVKQYKQLIEHIEQKRKKAKDILDNQWTYVKLHQELNMLYRQYDAPQNEEERLIYKNFFDNPLLQNPSEVLSSQAMVYFFTLKTFTTISLAKMKMPMLMLLNIGNF